MSGIIEDIRLIVKDAATIAAESFLSTPEYCNTMVENPNQDGSLPKNVIDFMQNNTLDDISWDVPKTGTTFFMVGKDGERIELSNRDSGNRELRGESLRNLLLLAKKDAAQQSLYSVIFSFMIKPEYMFSRGKIERTFAMLFIDEIEDTGERKNILRVRTENFTMILLKVAERVFNENPNLSLENLEKEIKEIFSKLDLLKLYEDTTAKNTSDIEQCISDANILFQEAKEKKEAQKTETLQQIVELRKIAKKIIPLDDEYMQQWVIVLENVDSKLKSNTITSDEAQELLKQATLVLLHAPKIEAMIGQLNDTTGEKDALCLLQDAEKKFQSINKAIVTDLIALYQSLESRKNPPNDVVQKKFFIQKMLSSMAGYSERKTITNDLIKQAVEKNQKSFKDLVGSTVTPYKVRQKSSFGGEVKYLFDMQKVNFTNAIEWLVNLGKEHQWDSHKNPHIKKTAYNVAKDHVEKALTEASVHTKKIVK